MHDPVAEMDAYDRMPPELRALMREKPLFAVIIADGIWSLVRRGWTEKAAHDAMLGVLTKLCADREAEEKNRIETALSSSLGQSRSAGRSAFGRVHRPVGAPIQRDWNWK